MMSKVVLDQIAIKRALTRITYEIIEQNRGLENLVLVGLKTRGAILAQRIAERIVKLEGQKIPVMSLDVTAYRDDRPKTQRPLLSLPYDLNQKHVVLVDDVLYTGRTVRAALDALLSESRPQKIALAVLIDRGHRELPIHPDFVGKTIPTARQEKIQVCVQEIDHEECVRLQS